MHVQSMTQYEPSINQRMPSIGGVPQNLAYMLPRVFLALASFTHIVNRIAGNLIPGNFELDFFGVDQDCDPVTHFHSVFWYNISVLY